MNVVHILFNPGPLTLVVAVNGQLMDAQTYMEGDPADRMLARLIRRGALVDLGPVPVPELPAAPEFGE